MSVEEKVIIRKKDLFLILDAMSEQWKKSRWKNADYILAINSIKLGMHWKFLFCFWCWLVEFCFS